MKDLFRWLDGHPEAYWIGAYMTIAITAVWVVHSFTQRGRGIDPFKHGAITGFILLAVILAWRWPFTLATSELNPDEGQLIAGAITLAEDPVFWRSVDGTTSGPLNFQVLLPTHWLGIPQDFFNARLTGLLLIWSALWAGFGLLQSAYGPALGLLGSMPALAFFATASSRDFIHYSSEHVSLALVMISAWLLWTAQQGRSPGHGPSRGRWLAAGLFLGLLPWAKLQSAPLAVALAGWGTWLALRQAELPLHTRWRTVARLAGAALAPSIVYLSVTLIFGQGEHFYRGYIENNVIYASSDFTLLAALEKLYEASLYIGDYPAFAIGPALTLAAFAIALAARLQRPDPLFYAGATMTAAAAIAVLAPRHGFQHYLLFTILPLSWWSAAALNGLFTAVDSSQKRVVLGLAFALVSVGLPVAVRSKYAPSFMHGQFLESWRNPYSEPSRLIRLHRQPGDRLALWGWNNQLYVETQLPQATRESHSTRQIWESSQRDSYYRPRYMEDLRRNTPAFFVDAVGPDSFFFSDRLESAHETFDELRDHLAAHYVLIEDFGPLRVYFRRDRLPRG